MWVQAHCGIFKLKVSLEEGIYRVFAIHGNDTLENLAEYILHVFKFDCDHAYGFYDNDYNEVYELFHDLNMDSWAGAKGVKKTLIQDVFQPKKQMIFLFDYGDEWNFLVECMSIGEVITKQKYPKLLEKLGRAPKQYAGYDDKMCK